MRGLTTREKIAEFMREFGRHATQDTRVYFTGGATSVLMGWRDSTIDIDLCFVPELDELFRAIPALQERLEINDSLMGKSKEQVAEDQFEIVGRDAQMWLAQAREMKVSADVILPKLQEALASPPARLGIREAQLAFLHTYMLLMGLAYENLIKGILIGRDPSMVDKGRIKSDILRRSGHGISGGANSILSLVQDEFQLLRRIEEYLFWAGRYPLPLRSGIYQNSEVQQLRSFRSTDPALIEQLFQKLTDILQQEWKMRAANASPNIGIHPASK